MLFITRQPVNKKIFYTFAVTKFKKKNTMKKIYTLALALIGAVAFAQTPLNTNGSLENWPDATAAPEGWFMTQSLLDNGSIAKVTGDAADGDVSVKIASPSSSNYQAGLADIAVTPGTQYTVTFWYKTGGDSARFRFWGQWRDANGTVDVTNDPFQIGTYIETATNEWTQVTISSTAPAGATILRASFRNYSNSSDLYIDDVVLSDGTVSVKDNNIAGLSVYPNPVSGNTLYVTSNNSIEKSVAIFDVLGKQVVNTTTSNGAININLNAGVYIVKVTEEGKTATRKLVVR
jgi:hypothetical protein